MEKKTCKGCQCLTCCNFKCINRCKAVYICDFKVTKCKDYDNSGLICEQ